MPQRKPLFLIAAALTSGMALAALLLGRQPAAFARAHAPAPAAYVPRPRGALTFNKDIAPLVFNNCASCHRPGEVAPFPLLSYADVKKRAQQIALVTNSRFMPPWKASEPAPDAFFDARHLTNEQIGMVKQWVEEGAKEGAPGSLPALPRFPDGWTMGQPDVALEPAEAYALAGEGRDVYRCFVLPTHYTEDRYVAAMEVRPGNSKVVHHVIAYLDTSGKARQLDAADSGPGYTSHGGVGITPAGALGGWAPGNMPHRLPEDVGTLLPKGADVVLQVHYHKSGKPETDKTRIGLYFCKKPVDKRVRILPVIYPFLNIQPDDANYRAAAKRTINTDITVLNVMPHMHLVARDMQVTATLPDGTERALVHVPEWDFNWQTTYAFKQPLALPQGSRINMVAHYDNSTRNPRNPNNPPKLVHWGEETTDEMCIAFVGYTVNAEHLTQGKTVEGLPDFGNRQGGGGNLRRKLRDLLGGK